jgi:hypothetical protein
LCIRSPTTPSKPIDMNEQEVLLPKAEYQAMAQQLREAILSAA